MMMLMLAQVTDPRRERLRAMQEDFSTVSPTLMHDLLLVSVIVQMLEGLQPGKNFTWSLLAQKKLTKFLDLNLNYFGRKTETSKTIHTGTVQLKAYF
jgi:hypothetical protein